MMSIRIKNIAVVFGLALAACLITSQADAAQIKNVYWKTVTFDSDDTNATVTLSSVVRTSKSIIILKATSDNAATPRDQNTFFVAEFIGMDANGDTDEIFVERGGASRNSSCVLEIVEFSDGVYVQSGKTNFVNGTSPTGTTKNITLASNLSNVSQAVPILNVRSPMGTNATDLEMTDLLMFKATFPSVSTLTLTRAHNVSTSKNVTVVYQVIEFLKDAVVYSGSVTLPQPGADDIDQSITATIPALSNSGNNAWLTFQTNPGTATVGIDSRIWVRGEITNSTTLTFTRYFGRAAANFTEVVQYYVVDFKEDGTYSPMGFGVGNTTVTALPSTMATGSPNTITAATNATPIQITCSTHNLHTGDLVRISGNTNAGINGVWPITYVSSTQFTLDGSTASGTNGGGTVTYPVTVAISSSTNASPIQITTATNHGLKTGDHVTIASHTLNTNANGSWTITRVGNTTFTLDGSTGNGVGAASGTVTIIPSVAITSSTNASPIVITTAAHGLSTGDFVNISGHTTNTSANGNWQITKVSATTFSLDGSTGVGVGGASGNVIRASYTTLPTAVDLNNTMFDFSVQGGDVSTTNSHADDLSVVGWPVNTTNFGFVRDQQARAVPAKVGLEYYEFPPLTITYPNSVTNVAISSSTNASPIAITTTTNHNLSTGDKVTIAGHLVNTAANGFWTVTKTSNTVFTLDNSTGNGVGAATGFVSVPSSDILVVGDVPTVTWKAANYASAHAWKLQLASNTASISSSTNASPIAITTASNHNLTTGDVVVISGHNVNTNANGTWNITSTGSNTFTLDGSTGNGVGAATGMMTGPFVDLGAICGSAGDQNCSGSNLSSTNSIQVKIPDNITTAARFRVYDTTNALSDTLAANQKRQSDATNGTFKIRGSITNVVTEPAAETPSNYWGVADSNRYIKWNQTGSIGTVRIDIDYNGDGLFDTNDNNYGGDSAMDGFPRVTGVNGTLDAGTTYKYAWDNAWDVSSSNLKVKVSAVTDAASTGLVTATSSAFEIRPILVVTSPIDTDEWNRGLTKNITWTLSGTANNVDIYLSYNNGSTYPTTIASNVGPCGVAPCYTYGSGTYTYPWVIDGAETITSGAKIKVVKAGQSPTSYTIGDTAPDGGDGAFDIIASLTLTAPTANLSPPWRVANDQTVTWTLGTNSGLTVVDVYYATDCTDSGPGTCNTGATWTLQANDVPATDLSYPWTNIPVGLKGAATGIKIIGNNNSNIYSIKGPFSVKANIVLGTITSPWRVGSNQTISWTAYGNPSALTVDWGTNGAGGPWPNNITSGVTLPTVSAAWNNIPATAVSSNVSIKVYEPGDSDTTNGVAAVSSVFSVKPDITNVALKLGCPASCADSSVFSVGDTLRVTWTVAPGSLSDTVNIKLDTASGTGGFPYTVATATASAGYADWVIPNNSNYVKTTDRIRVVSQADAAVTADSGNGTTDFQIKGSLLITNPTGPWKIGSTQSIDFTSNGVATVNIYYALDGSTFNDPSNFTKTVITNLSAVDGANSYSWGPIPDTALDIPASSIYNDIKTTIRFRVVDANNSSTYATTTTNLTMRKQFLSISIPATVYVDDVAHISWTTKGNTDVTHPVKLFYDTASGAGGYGNLIPSSGVALSDTQGYDWTVPDIIGGTKRIRVKSSTDSATVFDDMTSDFTVRGKIDTLVPSSAGLSYDYNSPITISWRNHGTLDAMTVKFDNGSTVTTIKNLTTTTANGVNTYVWQTGETGFPPAVGTTYKIKVEQDSDPTNVFVISGNNFRVKGVLNLTTANTDTLFGNVGDTVNITWTKSPATFADNQLYLYYSKTGATTCSDGSWVAITPAPNTTTGSPASWGWTIPDAAVNSAAFKLKIQDAASADCSTVTSYDISDATSASIKGRLTSVTTAGAPWLIGTTQNIGWTSNPSAQGDVLVELSLNGAAYAPVTGNAGTSTVTSQSAPFSWAIQESVLPNDYEANAKVRVKLVSDPNNVVAESSAFTIKKRYTSVAVPSSTLVVGDSNNVTWNTQGNVGGTNQVLLTYDTSGGSGGFLGTINSGNALVDNETYAWTVPDAIGNNVVVRVKSNAFPADVYGDSGVFSIKGKITPDSNQGTATLVIGQAATVNFTKAGTLGNLKIEYIHNGLSTIISPNPAGASGAASFNWSAVVAADSGANSVIDIGGTKNSTFKFTGLTHLGTALEATATSAAFQIRGDVNNLQLDTSATEGQVVYVGGSHLIRWKNNGNLGNVRIRMDRDGSGTFADVLTGPDGTYANAESIPYNYDGDAGGTDCGSTDSDYHCWEWTVPDASSTTARIRVESLDNPASHSDAAMRTFVATSNVTPFRIRGTYTNVSPTSAAKWKVASVNNIDWTASATMGNVNVILRYDSDGDTVLDSTSTLASNTSSKPYVWTIGSSIVTEAAKIRIQQTSDGTGTVYGESATFKIKPKLQLLLPNSNADQWVVGAQNNITWAAPQGSATDFKINISTDGGTTWNDGAVTSANKGGEIASSAPSAALAYANWTVPDIMTNQGVIRIRKAGDSDIESSDDSDAFFYVKGSITNVHIKNAVLDADPSVPIDLPIATTKYVTWNYSGSLGTVDLSYTTDANAGSPTYNPVPGGTGVSVGSGGSGSFAWTIPNAPSANVRVKVTSSTSANWQTVNGVSFASAGPTYNSIIGSITAVSVVSDGNGTDAVVGSNPKTILWTPNGAMLTYDIFYRVNGGSWVEIANNVAGTVASSDRTWSWAVIPDNISSNVQYRVVDHDNPTKTLFDSISTYRIRGSVVLTAPDGSQTLTVGTPYNIAWTKTGTIGNLKIELSTDDFVSDIREIHAGYASTSSPYAWTPSATVSPVINNADMNNNSVKIRLTSIGGIPVTDQSTDGNTIIGTITNVQPTGSGNVWLKGESRNITWSQIGNMDAVDIYYRTSGGVTPYDQLIVSNHTGHSNGANSYTWNPVHDVNSEDVWIQVKDHANPNTVFANSAAAFSIRPVLTVTAPVSADRLVVGANAANLIKWTTDGTVGGGGGTVKIYYDSGSGYTGNVIADNVPVGSGTAGVTWNPIPDIISSTVKIKVEDKSNTSVFSESQVFKVKGSVTLSSPQGGLHWAAADTGKTVTWSKTGTLPALDVEYNLAGGVGGWTSIGQAGVGATTINWTPLPTTATNTARVRVKADYVDDDLDLVANGTDFNIENVFSGLAPNNGAVVYAGDTLPHITWNVGSATGVSAVKIEFTNNQSNGTPTWTTITDTAPNTGDYAWTYPGTLNDLNNDCRLRITQWSPQNTNTQFVATGSAFSIKPAITITEPVADVSWGANTHHDIKFTKRGAIQTVNIYYAADGSTYDPTPINAAPINVSALADDTVYTYDWLIDTNTALTSGYTGKLKVKVNTPGTQTSVEKALAAGVEVEIKGTLTLNTPIASGITLYVGDTYNDITWSKFGAITNVDLHYSTNSGSTYPNLIVNNQASTPSVYAWTVPNDITSTAKIRVRDHNNTNVVNDPTGVNTFRILGRVDVTAPDVAGITWVVGQTNKTIGWTSTGTYATVDIDFARDGDFTNTGNYGATSDPNITNIGTFANCTPTNPAITCNGTATWPTVPDVITGTAKIRVRDAGFPTDVKDVSANAFKVIGSFSSITSPAASAVWTYPDTTKQIRWVSNGTMTNVKIEYKTSAGGAYTTIVANDGGHTTGNNTYDWTAGLPDVNTDDAYIKITDLTVTGSTASIEQGPFSIRPTITVTSPIASDRLVVGDTTQSTIIKWTYTGTSISTVKVQYDAGSGFTDISTNVDADDGAAGIAWNPIPNAISSDVKIRVIDEGNANVLDDSASFKIKGSLTVSNPTGGVSWTAADTTKSVSWTKTGTLPVIDVSYNLDGSNTWIAIGTTAAPTDTSLAWNPLPTTATNTARVRVVADYADNDLDVTTIGTNFSIGNTFSNLQPTNGAVVKVGDTLPHITWNVGSGTGISAVKIEFSNNQSAGTPTWSTVTDTAPNTGDYAWTYPGALADLSNDCRFRITQWNPQNASTQFVATGSAFAIQPTITITEPIVDSSWGANTHHDIKFTKRGAIQSVNIFYAADGSTYDVTPINSSPINISALADDTVYTYDWLIDANTALTSGYTGKIKIKVNAPGTQTAVEKALASGVELEVKGTLTLNTPSAAGITLYVGDTYNDITWSKFGAISNVDLHYSTNGGTSYPNLIANNIASTPSLYAWTVPNSIDSDIKIRVQDHNNNNVLAASANNFRILGKVDVTVPSLAGITWVVGDTNKAINWTSTGTYAAVEIDLARDGNFANTGNYGATSDPNITNIGTFANCAPVDPAITCNGSATWPTVPDVISGTAKIRVRDAGFPTDVQDESTNAFKIIGSFTGISSPATSAIWTYPDTTKQIRWAANGTISNVKIEYKTSSGGAYTTIVANDGGHTSGNNTYTWAAGLPDVNTDDAYIKVSDVTVAGSTAYIEAGPFSIRPTITVTAPTSGQQLVVGTNYPNLIKWSRTGTTISTVKVVYSTDGSNFPAPANVIASAVPVANGTAGIDWNIPASLSMVTTAKIRVIDEDNNNVIGDSAAFTLKGGLTLTAPSGSGTTIIAGSTTNSITWTYKGDFTVEVRYDPNSGLGADGVLGGGDDYPTLIGTKSAPGSNSGSNSLNWDLSSGTGTNTTTVTNKGRIKIFNPADSANVTSESSADFRIGGQFDVLTPENGAVAYAEDPYLITWTPVAGTGISNVKIEYSNNSEDPSPTWTEIDPGTTKANTGSYNWASVPGTYADLANTNRVQISQKSPLNASTVNISSGAPFSIKPTLTVTRPGGSGNETLQVGTAYPIKLTKKGAVQSIDLYYSFDGTAPNYVKINGAAIDISGSPDVNGEYTYNWTPLESHTLTAGGFPGKIKAKVVDPSTQVAVEDVQSNGTKLTGSLILNTPSAVITPLEVSDTYAITWTKYSVSNVRLFYSTNGGLAGSGTYPADNSPNIATVPATPATYNWTVPDAIGSNLRVRIMDDDNALVAVESANAFSIRGKLILDTPLNGTTQRVDDTVDIKWTPKGTMNTVKLEYSTDNFTLAGNIFPILGPLGESAAALPAGTNNVQQTFTWKIPDNISNTVRVRVVNNADANVKGTSTSDFKIVGWFDLTDPVGGVGVFKKVDDPFSVTWVRHGSIAQAKVEYSTDGFQSEPANVFLIGTVNSPAQSVSWPIPDAIGSNVKVRVSDPAYNGTSVLTQSETSAALEIRGQIKLNAARTVPGADSPLGGEIWLIGTDHTIQWEKHGTIGNVKVEYKVGSGSYDYIANSSATQATSVAGDTFSWRVPNQKGLDNVVIRVTATGDSNVNVVSNTFTIRAGFSWTNPSATDQVFEQGTTPTITWSTNGTVPTVDLKYSINGDSVYDGDSDPNYVFMKDTLGTDADNISNNNTFNWPVPTNITASKNVYFVVVDSTDPDAKNVSPKVKIAGVLAIDEPDNNPTVERWGVTTNQTIAWTMTGNVANVKIEYTKDVTAGTPVWETPAITTSVVGSTLSYNWTNIPLAAVSSKAGIRVSDVISDSGTTPAVSPLFKITGTFTPTAPTTGDVWVTTGTSGAMSNPTRNITWATQGVIPTADLYYSTTGNSPGAWTLINTGTPIVDGGAGGNYTWTVPQLFSSNMVIRIQDHDDALTYVDTGVFTVRGKINLTSPVGGELWGVSEAQSITWDSVGVVGSPNEVYIYYKKSAGGAWIQLQRPTLEYNIPNTGSFSWTPPESELSTAAYVKVENILAPTDAKYTSTESPASFKLMRRYQLLDPDGGEVYIAGQSKDITWNKWGTPVGDVRIDLDLDGSNTFATNIAVTTPNDGVYPWTPLASQVAPSAKIRIRDVSDTTNEKAYISGAPFVIRATLIMDAMPATVNIGDVYDILWTRQGNIANAKLVYTTTGNFALDSRPIEDLNGNAMVGGLVPNQDTVTNNPTRGRHQWKVPDLILSERANLQLRIVDPNDDPGSENISAAFRVIPKFTVTAPNGNSNAALTDKLKVGVPYDITWTSSSSSAADKTPNVTILYSVNGGGTYPNTITTTANDGSYTWTVPATGGVPDDISDQVKVKVVSAAAAEATALAADASDNNIKIISNFTLTAPNGGATYEVGDPFTITWTKLGSAANVSLAYSTDGGSTFPNTISAGTSNDLSEAWTGGIPDAIGTQVRVRVKSTTDDGEDISDANFRIRGKLTITAPAASTPVPIGQTYRITWTTNGTIPNVNIVYDTQDGAGNYPYTIATNVANVGYFDWVNVPDTGTNQAKIRVIDARVAESDVIGTSPTFNIVGNFTMLTPTNGDQLVVGSSYNVTWNWGGTIRFVKLSYTTNAALAESVAWTNITTVDYGPSSGDGANGTSVRTYAWTVPDNIAPNVRFKVENANDSSVYDVSTGSFKIRGGFAMSAPASGDRWVTNEVRNITWTTSGTIPLVNILYSTDNFSTSTTIASNVANNGSGLSTSYAWTVMDPGIANVPKSTKIRVVDPNDPSVSYGETNAFNVDYYNITWEIRDLVTNASLSQLTVNEISASNVNLVQWSEAGISTNPPRVQPTPYGTWVATWTKSGFGDGVQVVVANSDQSILLYMETSTVHIWLADSRVSYDPEADTLSVAGWLSRDGSITTGAVASTFKIYDGTTLLYTLTDNTVDAAGFFNWNVPAPTGFLAGKTYTTICEVTVGSGGVFKTPSSFQITDAAKLQDVKNTVNSVLDTPISVVQANIQTTLDNQTQTLVTKMDEQTQTIETVLTNFENTISTSIVSLESAAEQSLASAQTLEDTALKFSWKAVVAPNPALTGDTILLQAQGPRSLFPYLSVYNNKNKQVIANGLMTEDPARPGNYSYAFPADAGDFTAGEAYTYVVTEDITGGLVAGSGFIEAISLTSVAGLASAAPAAEKAAKEASAAIDKLRLEMAKGGNVEDAMKSLKRAIDDMKYASGNVPERENKIMRDRVAEIMEQVKQLAGDSGLNLDEMFTKAIEESSTVQEIRSRTGQINQAVDLIGAVVEKRLGGVEEPIVDIQLEPVS